MSKISVILTAIFMLFINQKNYALAPTCQYQQEKMVCSKGKIKQITHLGNLVLNETTVIESLWLTGNLDAWQAKLANSKVIGMSNLKKIKANGIFDAIGNFTAKNSIFSATVSIKGNYSGSNNIFQNALKIVGDGFATNDNYIQKVTVNGKFTAKNSWFEESLELTGCRISLDNAKTKSIIINTQKNCLSGIQEVLLANQTEVNGDILFHGGNGKVALTGNSTVSGRVIGGSIENHFN